MKEFKEKNIFSAVVLNVLLPGLGYIYMGKIVVGIAALFLIMTLYVISFVFAPVLFSKVWFVMNIIMTVDMLILRNKMNKKYEEETMIECPMCTELIKKKAKVCSHCGVKLECLSYNS